MDFLRLPAEQRLACGVLLVAAVFEQEDREARHEAAWTARGLLASVVERQFRHVDPQFRHAHVFVQLELALARVRGVVHFHHDVWIAAAPHRDVAVSVVLRRAMQVHGLVRMQDPQALVVVVQQGQAAAAVAGNGDAAHGGHEHHHLLELVDGPFVHAGGAVAQFPDHAGATIPQFDAALGVAQQHVLLVGGRHSVAAGEIEIGSRPGGGRRAQRRQRGLGQWRTGVPDGAVRLQRGVAVDAVRNPFRSCPRPLARSSCLHFLALDAFSRRVETVATEGRNGKYFRIVQRCTSEVSIHITNGRFCTR